MSFATDDLFTQSEINTPKVISLTGGEVVLYPTFLLKTEADLFFRTLHDRAEWKQEKIKMYGKEIPIPRLTAWYGDPGMTYTYSGIRGDSTPWLPELLEIKNKIENLANVKFNSVLLNLYRKGADGVAWHSDDEPELGREPVIASVSLGEERVFQMKHKRDGNLKQVILLPHGSEPPRVSRRPVGLSHSVMAV